MRVLMDYYTIEALPGGDFAFGTHRLFQDILYHYRSWYEGPTGEPMQFDRTYLTAGEALAGITEMALYWHQCCPNLKGAVYEGGFGQGGQLRALRGMKRDLAEVGYSARSSARGELQNAIYQIERGRDPEGTPIPGWVSLTEKEDSV